MSETPWWVCFTVGVYRVLLLLYPPSFRREFSEPMAQLLRDTSLETYRERGLAGLADLWVAVLADRAGAAGVVAPRLSLDEVAHRRVVIDVHAGQQLRPCHQAR